MLNVSTALSTPSPRGVPAPGRTGGGDFKDALDGLIAAPGIDTSLGLQAVKAPGIPITTSGTSNLPVLVALAVPMPEIVVDQASPPAVPPSVVEPEPTTCLFPALPMRRQAPADGGKTLPDDVPEDDPSKDVIWLPTALVSPVPAPVPRPLTPGATMTRAVAIPAGTTPAIADTPVKAGARSGEAIAPPLPPPPAAPASAGVAVDGVAPALPAKDGVPAVPMTSAERPMRAERPIAADGNAAAATQVTQPSPALPAPVLPAGQAFAAAIAAVVQQGRDEREPADPSAQIATATAALERLHTPVVAASNDARQAALDLKQDSGLQGMIDHIEVLRDGANAGDTRIRLIPDALGAVDVSVRRDGDRLHVHFNAENQTSARLISDAQPRLAELADARGVKLGQTSVDSGDGQSRRQQPATPTQFSRPVAVGDSIDTPGDLRVA